MLEADRQARQSEAAREGEILAPFSCSQPQNNNNNNDNNNNNSQGH